MSRIGAARIVAAAMAAAVLFLVLNYLESDRYPDGLPAPAGPLNADAPSWLAPELRHPCPQCGECVHRLELEECRLQVTVTDRDGWYRLFWAADEVYRYDDPALVGGSLWNRTAELTEGAWSVRGRYAPVSATKPHPCPVAAGSFHLEYRLKRGKFSDPAEVAIDPSGTLAAPQTFFWFSYRFPEDRQDDFWWDLENPTTFGGSKPLPCPCSKEP